MRTGVSTVAKNICRRAVQFLFLCCGVVELGGHFRSTERRLSSVRSGPCRERYPPAEEADSATVEAGRSYEIELITPLFGGGVEPGQTIRVFPSGQRQSVGNSNSGGERPWGAVRNP